MFIFIYIHGNPPDSNHLLTSFFPFSTSFLLRIPYSEEYPQSLYMYILQNNEDIVRSSVSPVKRQLQPTNPSAFWLSFLPHLNNLYSAALIPFRPKSAIFLQDLTLLELSHNNYIRLTEVARLKSWIKM